MNSVDERRFRGLLNAIRRNRQVADLYLHRRDRERHKLNWGKLPLVAYPSSHGAYAAHPTDRCVVVPSSDTLDMRTDTPLGRGFFNLLWTSGRSLSGRDLAALHAGIAPGPHMLSLLLKWANFRPRALEILFENPVAFSAFQDERIGTVFALSFKLREGADPAAFSELSATFFNPTAINRFMPPGDPDRYRTMTPPEVRDILHGLPDRLVEDTLS